MMRLLHATSLYLQNYSKPHGSCQKSSKILQKSSKTSKILQNLPKSFKNPPKSSKILQKSSKIFQNPSKSSKPLAVLHLFARLRAFSRSSTAPTTKRPVRAAKTSSASGENAEPRWTPFEEALGEGGFLLPQWLNDVFYFFLVGFP